MPFDNIKDILYDILFGSSRAQRITSSKTSRPGALIPSRTTLSFVVGASDSLRSAAKIIFSSLLTPSPKLGFWSVGDTYGTVF